MMKSLAERFLELGLNADEQWYVATALRGPDPLNEDDLASAQRMKTQTTERLRWALFGGAPESYPFFAVYEGLLPSPQAALEIAWELGTGRHFADHYATAVAVLQEAMFRGPALHAVRVQALLEHARSGHGGEQETRLIIDQAVKQVNPEMDLPADFWW